MSAVAAAPERLLERVRSSLDEVIDPCSVGRGVPAGLVAMGMVEELRLIERGGRRAGVRVSLRITSPACTFQPYFEREVRARLAEVDQLGPVEIAWSKDFDWSDDDMSEELKARLRRMTNPSNRDRRGDGSS